MSFQKQFEDLIKQVGDLEKAIFTVKDLDIIPLSFFSSSIDLLNQFKADIHGIELAQFNFMQEHLKKMEEAISNEQKEAPMQYQEDTPVSDNKVFLSDVITKEKLIDFRKSLSLNERFMFQRDIFQNNADKMNLALETLNRFDNLNEALNYLNGNHPIQWESEAGTTFRELLEKRFS